MRLIFLITFVTAFGPAFAQTVTIDNVSVPVEYYRMPERPLDKAYTTYSAEIEIDFDELSRTNLTQSRLISDYLYLDGYKKVNFKGDIHIEAFIGDFINWGEYHKTTRNKQKDKDGNEKTVTKHYIELRYSMPVGVLVTDKNGDRLLDKYIFTNSDTRTWTSPSYNSLSDLDSYWRIEKQRRFTTIQTDRIKEGMNQITAIVNAQFGYTKINDHTRFETIGKKKHPDYDLYQKQVEAIKEAFKLMDADQGLDNIRKAIQPALDFYKSKESQIKGNGKDELRLKHIVLFNQGLAYFWMEDFEKSREYGEKILKLDPKDKDAKRLVENTDEVVASLNRTNRKSRHVYNAGKT